jgi:carboxymethylenebutenolidase
MNEQMVKLKSDDGFVFDAFQVSPDNPHGGLVVLQEIFGVGEQLQSVARWFAGQGFDTVVPAMFDRVSAGTVIPFDQADRGREIMLKLDIEQALRDVAAAIRQVDGGKGVSVLGYCWGGGIAIRAAGMFDLAGAVAYYGTSLSKHMVNGARCPTLFHFGDSDSHSPPEVIEEVKRRIPAAEIHLYHAGHAFANDARSTYVADAARLANERTLAFLKRVHGD